MLYKFTNKNKYGGLRSRIIYHPDGKGFGINPKGLGNYISVNIFKYIYNHPVLPPSLFTDRDGKKFIVPTYQEVLPETELTDIDWVKPKIQKEKPQKTEFQFESKSDPGHFYKVTVTGEKVDCTCSGRWRAKDRQKGCTHMQQVRKQLGLILKKY